MIYSLRGAALTALTFIGGLSSMAQAPDSNRLRLVPQSTDMLVADIEESADGARLITHDRRFAPRLWDAKTFRLLRVLGGAQDPTPVVRFSPDGKLLLTLGTEELRVWDAVRAKPIARYAAASGEFLVEAKFSPDGQRVALSSSTGTVRLMESQTGKPIRSLEGLQSYVPTLDWSADGKRLAAGSGSSARVWDTATGKATVFTSPSVKLVREVDLNDAGTLLAITDNTAGATVFDASSAKALYTTAHVIGERTEELRSQVGACFVLPNDASLLTFGPTGDLILLDAATGKEQRRLKGHSAPVDELRLSRDRKRAGTHGDDERVLLWDLTTGQRTPFALKPGDLPTAATFSAQSTEWYLGLANGELRKYDLLTGKERSGTLGGTNTIARIRFLGDKRLLAVTKNSTGSIFLENLSESKSLALPARTQDASLYRFAFEHISDSGRYNISDARGNVFMAPVKFTGYDLWTGKGLFTANADDGQVAEFLPGADFAQFTFSSGLVFSYDFAQGKEVNSVAFNEAQPGFTGAISPDGLTAAHGPYQANNTYVIWTPSTKEIVAVLDQANTIKPDHLKFSPDGQWIGGVNETEIVVWNAKTGKIQGRNQHALTNPPDWIVFSRDSSRAIAYGPTGFGVMPIADPLKTTKLETPFGLRLDMDQSANRSGSKALTWNRNNVRIWNADTGKEEGLLKLNDQALGAVFSPDDARILTLDPTDGIVIWDAKSLKRLGNAVQMRDGSWLVMDNEGRYDANDPDDIAGAMYVLEWAEGLEPLEVAQFKSQFWDPGLLSKLLGTSKEPLRRVPSLNDLKLFPTVDLRVANSGDVTVGLNPRDGGGIGRVTVSVNGKEIATRQGVGFFTVRSSDIRPYLLPETRMAEGQTNVLTVRASNAEGTLTSLPSSVDLGFPEGLRAPEVRLFGLFVGVGDYVGSSRDLRAPPSDASRLSFAVQTVAKGLLKDRVNVTTLTTGSQNPAQAPTRENVLRWFEQTAKEATSSDILLVYFSGHGVDKIGNLSGYFFLTAEANPDTLSAATLPSMSVSADDLRVQLKAIAANKQVVILDTCHSGAAAGAVVGDASRSVSGDFQRAWESIKDATGTWMLAGSAADQLSYESTNVDHGMLTYSLLEAIDRASSDGLRPGQGGELFVDIERWLTYAANRVESLKNEVGLTGIQRPEFKRSAAAGSFDLGVLNTSQRGLLQLRAPRPIVIVGPFELDQEDPAGLEDPVRAAFGDSQRVKAWTEVSKHPNVYRVAGEYTLAGEQIKVKVFLQRFDALQKRSTLQTFEVEGTRTKLAQLAEKVVAEVEKRIQALEEAQQKPN